MNYIENMNDEMRCEYLVSSIRKQLWNIELDIYEEFKRICQKYHLQHFLIYGSALGAERHQGFIPWDDDLDIGMTRDDFNTFLEVVEPELDRSYSITYGLLENRVSPLLRIRNNYSTGIICGELKEKHSKGVFIEIYVFDRVLDDPLERNDQIQRIEELMYYANFKLNTPPINNKDRLVTWVKLLGKSGKSIWQQIIKECTKNNQIHTACYNSVQIPEYARKEELLIYADDIYRVIEVPFENTTAFVLQNNKAMLKRCYGDYMELPPIEKRGTHHDNIVFYDPTRPYTYYQNEGKQLVQDFFAGKYEGVLN